ncbi:DUF2461 domain-containing protein [Pedobacter cryophilus]|uniref:DUF2461 domain-containing protein n=1 Tax=Pedobacter cryophilus TaxID=2571271 RepID=A0A4U1C4R7_9SPHI|nr:DUF2461 domain-containing protein [Pedobacter cryophilus]TKC00255.1 DUF2461 domain-containing protein [Pedobacter cryophilus]
MIKKETLAFVNDLIAHNDRVWFQENKSRYDDAKKNVDDFANVIIAELIKTDGSIPKEITAKQCVMRIYRDVRFSKDKSPYKNNFGIGISARGKGNDGAGYYIHIQPGASFVAGGYWLPQAEHLKAIRQEIDYNTGDLLKVIDDKEFKDFFGGFDKEQTLKTTPKGYDAEHPYIEILKLKSFTVTHSFTDEELMGPNAVAAVLKGLKLIYPLNVFLSHAIL